MADDPPDAPAAPDPPDAPDTPEYAHATRSVVALLVTVFCASAGTMAGETALGKQVFDITHRELDLGWLGLIEFLPAAVLVLVTGTVADRYERRKIVFFAASAQAAVALALAYYARDVHDTVTPIFAMVLVLGVARAFVAPAERALTADVVPAERLPWLIPRFSFTWQVALIIGPIIGGVLYAVTPEASYVATAALFAIAALSMLAVDVQRRAPATVTEADEAGGLAEALEGVRFIRRHAIVLGAISLDLVAVLFGGAVALLPAITEERLGAGAVGLGLLRAAYGLGAALVTLWLALRPVRRHVGRRLLFAVATFGAGTIVLGLTHSYAIAFIALAVLAGADAVSVFIRATLVPLSTPVGLRGRVLAVENVFIGGSNELGAFESGVAGQIIGPGPAVVLGGAATLVVAGLWGRLFPALRNVDGFPEPPPD